MAGYVMSLHSDHTHDTAIHVPPPPAAKPAAVPTDGAPAATEAPPAATPAGQPRCISPGGASAQTRHVSPVRTEPTVPILSQTLSQTSRTETKVK